MNTKEIQDSEKVLKKAQDAYKKASEALPEYQTMIRQNRHIKAANAFLDAAALLPEYKALRKAEKNHEELFDALVAGK